MRVAIVGPGALGLLFYTLLHTAGNEVYLIDKDRRRARFIARQGINFITLSGKVKKINPVNITVKWEEIPPPQMVILTVKSYHTSSAVRRIKSVIGKNCYLLSVQNGLGNAEIIRRYVTPQRILLGVTNQGATRIDLNTVRHAGKGDTIIGSYLGKEFPQNYRFLARVKTVFNKAGINTKTHSDIHSVIWSKLIINVGINALTAITGYRNGKLIEIPAIREIMSKLVDEAWEVAKRKGIKLLYSDCKKKVEEVCRNTAGNISSMLQDVLNNRRTEIDAINGAVIKEGKKLGLELPYNFCVYKIVKGLEKNIPSRVFTL